MPASCPICEQPIASTALHCSVCGFPTGLAIEGLRSNDGADAPATPVVAPPAAAPPKPTPGPKVLSPEEDLNAAISRDLRSKMELVADLGRGAPDLTNELCQAALSEADGRVAEALAILRTAQSRLETETDELLHRRLGELGERREALERTGARVAIGEDIRQAQQAIDAGEREDAVRLRYLAHHGDVRPDSQACGQGVTEQPAGRLHGYADGDASGGRGHREPGFPLSP